MRSQAAAQQANRELEERHAQEEETLRATHAAQEQAKRERGLQSLQDREDDHRGFTRDRDGDLHEGLMKLGGPSMKNAPPPTQAGRERLRLTLEQALQDFDACFNTASDAMSCLGAPILQMVAQLRAMTTDDTDALTALLVRGRDLSADDSANLEQSVVDRAPPDPVRVLACRTKSLGTLCCR